MKRNSNIISVENLRKCMNNVQIIDCSWHMPNTGRSGLKEYLEKRIPSAKFLDIDDCADKASSLSHMMPKADYFKDYINKQGIDASLPTVVYDTHGIFSAPRGWFMLKAFGFESVSVLNGGMKAWLENNLPIEESEPVLKSCQNSSFSPKDPTKHLISCSELHSSVKQGKITNLIDVRPKTRFDGSVSEPRVGLKSGHIPGSVNVPFSDLVTEGKFNSVEDQESKFKSVGVDMNKSFMFTCGSGLTACIPLLTLVENFGVPFDKCQVYDGSFSEWGLVELDLPVNKS